MRARNSVNVARSVLLDQYAHRNRQKLTPSEARLWAALSGRKLGVQFRRQVVIDGRFMRGQLCVRCNARRLEDVFCCFALPPEVDTQIATAHRAHARVVNVADELLTGAGVR